MRAALEHREPVTIPRATTVADGIAVRRAGDHTYPLVRRYVDSIVTVEEEEIAKAILLLLEREKMLAEGAGAGVEAGAWAWSPVTPRQNIAMRVADHLEIFSIRVPTILAYP